MGRDAAVNIVFENWELLFRQFSSIESYLCLRGGNPVCCVNILPLTGCATTFETPDLTGAAVEFFFRALV